MNQADIIKNEINLEVISTLTWCNECQQESVEACGLHKIHKICDKDVFPRSKASIPNCLKIREFLENEIKVIGIFAKKKLSNRICFGPFVAEKTQQPLSLATISIFTIIHNNDFFEYLDTKDNDKCNWMKFVRLSQSVREQNLEAYQQGLEIYFTTTRKINMNEELKVWFSPPYASKLELFFENSDQSALLNNYHDEFNNYKTLIRTSVIKNKSKQIKKHLFWKKSKTKSYLESSKKEQDESIENENNSALQTDNESNNIEKKYFCKKCSKEYESFFDLKKHKKQHKSIKLKNNDTNSCSHCFKKFPDIEKLRKHYLCHLSVENKPFRCKNCEKCFLTKGALISHTKMHELIKHYLCKLCNAEFARISALRSHSAVHLSSISNMYKCTKCTKEFKSFRLASLHYQFSHSQKNFKCETCDLSFINESQLIKHSLCHGQWSNFMCEICSRQFKRKDKLKDHYKRIHLSGKYDLKRIKNCLTKFTKLEDGTGSYTCDACSLSFKRRGMLVNHLTKRHPHISLKQVPKLNQPIIIPVRDFFCQYCKKIYKSNNKRKEHILKKHPAAELPSKLRQAKNNNRPMYSAETGHVQKVAQLCPHCPRQYATRAKLLQHIRNQHKDVVLSSLKIESKCDNYSKTFLDIADTTKSKTITSSKPVQIINMNSTNLHSFQTLTVNAPAFNVNQTLNGNFPTQNIFNSSFTNISSANVKPIVIVSSRNCNTSSNEVKSLINHNQSTNVFSSNHCDVSNTINSSIFLAQNINPLSNGSQLFINFNKTPKVNPSIHSGINSSIFPSVNLIPQSIGDLSFINVNQSSNKDTPALTQASSTFLSSSTSLNIPTTTNTFFINPTTNASHVMNKSYNTVKQVIMSPLNANISALSSNQAVKFNVPPLKRESLNVNTHTTLNNALLSLSFTPNINKIIDNNLAIPTFFTINNLADNLNKTVNTSRKYSFIQ